jgi:hypothetical protein
MFLKIDTILIVGARWTLRQIELFTSKKNKDIGVLLLLINLFFSFFILFSLIVTMSTKNTSDVLFLWSILFLQHITHSGLYTRIRSPNVYDTQPKEVKSRQIYRMLLIFYCAYFGYYVTKTIFFFIEKDFVFMGFRTLLGSLILLTIFTPLFVEYFLCTTPLSLEELETKRRKLVSVPHEHIQSKNSD